MVTFRLFWCPIDLALKDLKLFENCSYLVFLQSWVAQHLADQNAVHSDPRLEAVDLPCGGQQWINATSQSRGVEGHVDMRSLP